jgi:dihydroneopterin aldolase
VVDGGSAFIADGPRRELSAMNLDHCTRLALRGLAIDVSIGVFEHEKKAVQPVRVDIEVWVPSEFLGTPTQDRLDEVIDYGRLRQIAIQTLTEYAYSSARKCL